MKNSTSVIALSAASLAAGELIFLGYRYRFGPFRSLGEKRIRNLSGNRPEYAMNRVTPLPDHPLRGKRFSF